MGHRISHVNGRYEIAYAGEAPWHGLGRGLTGLQAIPEMLREAGLGWTVSTQPCYLAGGVPVPGYRAVIRDDTRALLGVVSNRYVPIQNAQAGEIADALVAEGQAVAEVAGTLDQGKRCWLLLKLPDCFEVTRDDLVDPYFLLAWGHDGKHGLAGKLTPIRVVCHNTLATAGFGEDRKWSHTADIYFRHQGQVRFQIDEARRALGLVKKQAESTAQAYRALAAIPANDEAVSRYFGRVFPAPEQREDETPERFVERLERWQARQSALRFLYETAPGAELARGTAWGAYNAVTAYLDHAYPVTVNGNVSRTRQASVLFGSHAQVRVRALGVALALNGS